MSEENELLTGERVTEWKREAQGSDCEDFLALCDGWLSLHAQNTRLAAWIGAVEEVLENAGPLLAEEINRRAEEAEDE